jgi:hypothetical protein
MRLIESVLVRTGQANKWRRFFIVTVLELMLMVPGRATFRNLSRYSVYGEKTFSRGFGREFDWVLFNREAIDQVIPRDHEQALVLDASFIDKSGRCTYGLDRFWNGSASRAEKGLEVSVLSWLDLTTHQAYTLSVEQTPPKPVVDEPKPITSDATSIHKGKGKRGKGKTTREALAEESRIDAYLAQVRYSVETYQLQWLKWLIVDGYYAKVKFIDGIINDCGLDLIGKLRADANMRYLYNGPKRPGRGKQKQFDGKVDWSDVSRFNRIETDDDDIVLYQHTLNHKHFKRTLNVVVVVDNSGSKPRQAILYSTDLELPALTVYNHYKARFQIEFLIRDAKQATGLGDCQARDKDKLHFHFNASLAAASIAKLEAQQQAGGTLNEPFSIHSLQRRAFSRHLIDRIIDNLEAGQTLTKFTPLYETLCNYGTISQKTA